MTGYPGKPGLASIEGQVVHDDLETAGEFDLLQPAAEPHLPEHRMGRERQLPEHLDRLPAARRAPGLAGDRSAECKGETYLFNIAALYAKWLQDMADAQKANGSVSDVCPAYWPIYSDNVTWPSSTVIIPGALREQFADSAIIARHYASAKKWMDYMGGFVKDGIISRDTYGDWCVPPEDPKLIHSNDPARKTDKALLATAYFYHDCALMARYATLLGKTEDAQHFTDAGREAQGGLQRRNSSAPTPANTTTARRPPACCRWPLAWCPTASASGYSTTWSRRSPTRPTTTSAPA